MNIINALVKVYKLPWGGSITLLSMVPICLYSIKRGAAAGMAVSFVYSVVQLLLDLGGETLMLLPADGEGAQQRRGVDGGHHVLQRGNAHLDAGVTFPE